MKHAATRLLCGVLFVMTAFSSVKAQYAPRLMSVSNPTDKEHLRVGKLLNIEVSYRLDSTHTPEQALAYLNDYNLTVDGISYPDAKIQSMTLISNTNSVPDARKMRSGTAIYQTRLPSGFNDTTVLLSDFWKNHFKPLKSHHTVAISLVSVKPGNEKFNEQKSGDLVFYESWRVVVFIVIFLALLILVLYYASKGRFSMLRDDKGCTADPLNNTFSLSRVQVFIWTFVIFPLVAYLWSVTDIFPEIKASHLILLGIVAGQKILAQMVDGGQSPKKDPSLVMSALTSPASPPGTYTGCSVGFFTDIISDSTGLSITRLQYVIANFIFLVVFVVTAIQKLTLVDFSVEQLALMGTSTGLYLWNKKLDQ